MAPCLTLAAALLLTASTAAIFSAASSVVADAARAGALDILDDDATTTTAARIDDNHRGDPAERLRAALAAAVAAGRSAVRQLRRQSVELARLRAASDANVEGETARKRSGESVVAVACGADAVALGGHCRSVRRLFGLTMDAEAAALCDGHRLCTECAASAFGVAGSDEACDAAFTETAARACLGEANPVACGRQADQLLAAMRLVHRGRRLLGWQRSEAAGGSACSRVCAETLFS